MYEFIELFMNDAEWFTGTLVVCGCMLGVSYVFYSIGQVGKY